MKFEILGPLGVPDPAAEGANVAPRAAKMRVILATLLVRANEAVPMEGLVDELWGDSPPRTATTTIQVYVSQLRKLLRLSDRGDGESAILTRRPGYLLRLDPERLDLTRFGELYERGRTALEGKDYPAASELHRTALGMWRGDFLADTPHGPLLEAAGVRLAEMRMAALEQRIRADLHLGRHHDLMGELHAVAAEHPLREELHAHLMVGLYRTGRQAEALKVFATVRRTLVDELAIEPGPPLQRLHQRILGGDTSLLRPAGASGAHPATDRLAPGPDIAAAGPRSPGSAGSASGDRAAPERPAGPAPVRPAARPRPVPVSLPDPDPAFTSRAVLVAEVERELRDGPPGGTVVLTGKPGIGKSATALAVAHRLADAFPDGRLHLDLAPGQALTPEEALARLLRRTGEEGPLPSGAGELRAALLRRLAGLRVLLVLDNAESAAQVRPLLPSGDSRALVTSRRVLGDLTGARFLPVGVLRADEAYRLLVRAMGRERETAHPDALHEIARLCGWLPLALRIAAALLAAKPHWSPASLAVRLRDEHARLSTLSIGNLDVRNALSAGSAGSDERGRRAFWLLALAPRGGFGLWVGGALLDTDPDETERLVEELVEAQLLDATRQPDASEVRYEIDELSRLLALERLAGDADPHERDAAVARLCEAYSDAAEHAWRLVASSAREDRPASAPTAATAQGFALSGVVGGRTADWFEAHRGGLVHTVLAARSAGLWQPVLRLVGAMTGFLEAGADWADWAATHEVALDAAEHCGDRGATASLERSLGTLAWQQRRIADAEGHYGRAREAGEAAGDRAVVALAVAGLAELRLDEGRFDEAEELLATALPLCEELPTARGTFEVRRLMALLELRLAGPAAACERFTDCLELAGTLRDRRLEAYAGRALRQLGEMTARTGEEGRGRGARRSEGFEVRPGVWRLHSPDPVPAR